MNRIKFFLGLASLYFLIYGCAVSKVTSKPDWYNIDNNIITIEVFDCNFTENQLDSLCVADTLERDYTNWVNSTYGPDNYGEIHTRYIISDTTGLKKTYILEINDNGTYNVKKRIRNKK